MSCAMQDSINQRLSRNFAEAMPASIDSSILVFLGNDYDARNDYKLEVQERIWHPVVFHAKIKGDIMYLHNL